MKNAVLALLLLPAIASADVAVDRVQVNIHNDSQDVIAFQSFDASRIFTHTHIIQNEIAPNDSVEKAIMFHSFDKESIRAGTDVMVGDEPMTLMWQINMGVIGPDADKFHICGVIKDRESDLNQEYCDIPYVQDGTLFVDFYIN